MHMNIPLTIEKQLENYATAEGHSDRHEVLWHAWHQNKRWISQLLEVTLSSFPTYSRHDETHALSVLNNIEMILGQERIEQLSATDCFVLLHTVYIHDIGMCITQRDRKEIIENEAFIDMIDRLETDGDETTVKAIKTLKRTDYESDNENRVEYFKQLYRAKLDVYYAIIELIANYRRAEHGEKSKDRLYEWILEPDKLGTGFSMAGVPMRIFLAIARSAQMHTCNNFDEINKLPRKDGGYASDYYHPRFIAVLLMLGDLLDMDNDRFHPMVLEFVEEFPEASKSHYDKHRAIRRLNISPNVIEIEADCKNQNALRLVRRECDMLVDILNKAGYRWTSICPDGFKGSLPFLKEINLYLNGKKIPEELVTTQFTISQKKAFSILEGSNLYDGRFVFLREFLQNAIDATKMQYWYDYMGTAAYYYGVEQAEKKSPNEMNKGLTLEKYPIEISMKLQKRDNQKKTSDVSDEEIKEISKGRHGQYEYGVLVSIKDFGTGIDKESIIAISKVGNSRVRDKKVIQKMPKWLRPTAEFGVGLQSAFLLTGSFKCTTYTRSGERYEITFNSGASSHYEGYINVAPIEHFDEKKETYGTCFEVFVPLDKKYLHSESICTWSGSDPFSADYDKTRIFRHASELISQMALYLDGILGELLFPIKLRVDDQGILDLALNRNENNKLHKIQYQLKAEAECVNEKSWVFREDDEHFLWGNMENAFFALEYETARLYIWAKEINASCVVSGANLIKQDMNQEKEKTQSSVKKGIRIFYKGIQLQWKYIEEIEIFEFIDIKGNLARPYININRRGFTSEGEKYFENEIYRKLLNLVREILQFINKDKTLRKKVSENVISKIENHITEYNQIKDGGRQGEAKQQEKIGKLAEQLVSLAFLSHLAVKDVNDELSKFGKKCGRETECVWQDIIWIVNGKLGEARNIRLKEALTKYSVLFGIQGYGVNTVYQTYTILDLFSNENHFGILQRREEMLDTWTVYIVSVSQNIYEMFEKRMLSESVQIEGDLDFDEQIEMWANNIFDIADNIGVSVSDSEKYRQQFLLSWMLRTIPTIGMFCNEDGNRRFNVLGDYVYPYIYTNKYHRRQTVERMLQTAVEKNFNRFSIYAWQGRQFLTLKNVPFSCFFVKRGYLNDSSIRKVIVPIEGEILHELYDAIVKLEEVDLVKNVRFLAVKLDFKNFYSELMQRIIQKKLLTSREQEIYEKISDSRLTKIGLDADEFFSDIIADNKSTQEWDKNSLEEYFIQLRASEREWDNFMLDVIDAYIDEATSEDMHSRSPKVSKLKKKDIFKLIAIGWKLKNKDIYQVLPELLKTEEIKKSYMNRCEEDSALKAMNQRIIDYIMENGHYPMRKNHVEQCFYAFMEEIFDIAKNIENDRMRETLKKYIGDKE